MHVLYIHIILYMRSSVHACMHAHFHRIGCIFSRGSYCLLNNIRHHSVCPRRLNTSLVRKSSGWFLCKHHARDYSCHTTSGTTVIELMIKPIRDPDLVPQGIASCSSMYRYYYMRMYSCTCYTVHAIINDYVSATVQWRGGREGGREGGEEYHINGCYHNGYTQAIRRLYTYYYSTHIQCHTTYVSKVKTDVQS